MTNDLPRDCTDEIVAAISAARESEKSLYITAGGSKSRILGRDCDASSLDVSAHRGILDYQPAELVIRARAATPLLDIAGVLAENNQMLASESPLFDGRATLGGTVACNLSGPARPWSGSIRDLVLGVTLVNGKGEILNFGGQVMKNVAGYDVSRLQCGALGTLGVLSEISFKVMPKPEHSLSLAYEMTAREAIDTMNRKAGEPRPLTGACWVDGRLHLRVAGATSAVEQTARTWGGEVTGYDDSPWQSLREYSLPFFEGDAPLWRLSVKSTAATDPQLGEMLIDWCGAQRWLRGEQNIGQLQQSALAAGGHVVLFRGGNRSDELRTPLNAVEQRLQQRLKNAFDPDGILNPGRLYSWL